MSLVEVQGAYLVCSHLRHHTGSYTGQYYWTSRGRAQAMEHLNQALPNAGFKLCAISCNLDLAIGIPWVAEAAGAVKW